MFLHLHQFVLSDSMIIDILMQSLLCLNLIDSVGLTDAASAAYGSFEAAYVFEVAAALNVSQQQVKLQSISAVQAATRRKLLQVLVQNH